jgi:Tol biopolymer transport system component
MKTDSDLDRQLRSILREELDREVGPDPTWAESPAARRVAEQERRARRRWPLRVLAVAALLGAIGGAAIAGGALDEPPDVSQLPANGWIAFTAGPESDIWLVALDQPARRVIGTDTDDVDQLCPAFSLDGLSLAYGRVEGQGTEYRQAALVVADVSADGRVSDRLTFDMGDGLPPPCPVWSPDGDQLAFGVPRTSPINPDRSGEDSEVWVLRLADRDVTILPNLLATDLEWSPDGSRLAIVGGVETASGEGVIDGLQDGRIHLYDPASGDVRSLDSTLGAGSLTWAPDSRRIAYTTGQSPRKLRLIDVDTGEQDVLASDGGALHGIGPVWSPDGRRIAYQRGSMSSERTVVVLVTPGDLADDGATSSEVFIRPPQMTVQGSEYSLYPFWVAWSPDGEYLFYVAWGVTQGKPDFLEPLMAAVPIDPEMPSVVLALPERIDTNDGYDDTLLDTTYVPIQTWGRHLAD